MKRPILLVVFVMPLTLAGCNSRQSDAGNRVISPSAAGTVSKDNAALVNPFVGSQSGAADFGTGGGAGNTFPGAVMPFGMLQFSPDTTPSLDNVSGGYSYVDTKIGGFSLTHLSGAGCATFRDIPIMPTVAPVNESPAELVSAGLKPQFQASFDHDHEQATPGYYQVQLNPQTPQPINVELTATQRSGAARFAFPVGSTATVLVNAGGSIMPDSSATVTIDPLHNAISGVATSGGFCYQTERYTVYFYAEFKQPFKAYGTWRKALLSPSATTASDIGVPLSHDSQPIPGGPQSLPGDPSLTARAGAYVSFDTATSSVVQMRVGISFVSVANARANLQKENSGWDFGGIRAAARNSWNEALGRIDVSGGTPQQQRVFYTSLYHSLLTPSVFNDVNGEYLGMDGAVHQTGLRTVYSSFSGWDTYRSQMPLLAMLYPQRSGDMMQSLVLAAQQSGWLPKWSYANQQTGVMVGDPADLLLASSHAFGVRGFDAQAALRYMIKGAAQPASVTQVLPLNNNSNYIERPGLTEYQTLGYIPYEENVPNIGEVASRAVVWGTSATTLEYALADFAVDHFANALGQGDETPALLTRSTNWRKVFNPATGYMEPKLALGLFVPSNDPASGNGFVEGSSAQYSWFVPQDMAGLIAAMGGRQAAAARLDDFFAKLNAGPESTHAFLGNEPTLFTPWLYAWVGQPNKTGPIVKAAMTSLYDDAPTGMPGNDDLGSMSAWWVLSALGLAPVIPGTDALLLNAPLFNHATIHLPGGDLHINRTGQGVQVQSVTRDGRPQDRAWLPFTAIATGATLDYQMGDGPSGWATSPDNEPPSYPPVP
jgi:predicted alpha-1,2-mannosidase